MEQELTFAVIGGDLRQLRIAERLAQDGFAVTTFAIDRTPRTAGVWQAASLSDAVSGVRCVILSLPVLDSSGHISTPLSPLTVDPEPLFSLLSPGTLCFAGKAGVLLSAMAEARGIPLLDYLGREELAVRNAIPTAEGAIQIAMERLPVTLHGSHCLVLGYGRIGKILSRSLMGLGARVTVSARKWEDLAWIRSMGAEPIETAHLEPALPHCQVVFNTIPAPVLGAPELGLLPRDALCVDLASAPGGIDDAAAKRLGLDCVRALSLPGKVAPDTAGEIIYDTIFNMLKERKAFPR